MTEYTEDDFMPLLEQLDTDRLYWDDLSEVAEGCAEIANHFSPHTDAAEGTVKASAIYSLCRLIRNSVRIDDVADVCGVSHSAIGSTWRQMAEVAIRKDDEIDIDSEELINKL